MNTQWYEFTGPEGNELKWQPAVDVDEMQRRGEWVPCPPHSTPTTFSHESIYRRKIPAAMILLVGDDDTDAKIMHSVKESVKHYANRLRSKFNMKILKIDVNWEYQSPTTSVEIRA